MKNTFKVPIYILNFLALLGLFLVISLGLVRIFSDWFFSLDNASANFIALLLFVLIVLVPLVPISLNLIKMYDNKIKSKKEAIIFWRSYCFLTLLIFFVGIIVLIFSIGRTGL